MTGSGPFARSAPTPAEGWQNEPPWDHPWGELSLRRGTERLCAHPRVPWQQSHLSTPSKERKNLQDWGEELGKRLQRERTRPRAGKFRLKNALSLEPCMFTSLCFTKRISILRTQSDLIYLWSNCRNKNKMQPQGITPQNYMRWCLSLLSRGK